MSKSIPGNQKHLTLNGRIDIEKGLNQGLSLRQIAKSLGKDPSTISKEIRKHRTHYPHSSFNESHNKCARLSDCKKKNICGTYAPVCKKPCRRCPLCNRKCPDFVPMSHHCDKLDKAPFVCNNCSKKIPCRLDKAYYRASTAHRQYRTVLVESRNGINISEDDLKRLDELVSPLIRHGQSPFMILQHHPEIELSEKTLYNYIDSGALSVKNIDLPKKVKYKVRSVHDSEIDDTGIFEGRTFKDFQEFLREFPDTAVTEMDTVLGTSDSHKTLLTLNFNCCDFMMAFLLDSKRSCHVESVFDCMDRALGTLLFARTFPVILCDRGGEFKHPDKLECSTDNFIRTSIFYCDPMCSWQKPNCEKNHEYIRKICPKGYSFDGLSQSDVRLMMSHINCSPRQSLGGLSPFALAKMMLPKELLSFFALKEIDPDNIILTPELLRR